MKFLILVSFIGIGLDARAGVTAYAGTGGETLLVETTGSDSFAKADGVQGDWNGKVLKVERQERPSGERFVIKYKARREMAEYQMIVGNGKTLIEGSLVPSVKLYTQGGKNPVTMHQDAKLTASSQKAGLQQEYGKAPFTPKF